MNTIIFPPSSGSGGTTVITEKYTNATPVPTTIGGITAGSTFSSKTMTEMWNMLLYPYQVPAFTSFSSDMPTTLELGDSIASGLKVFSWATSNSANVKPNTVAITYGSALGSALANDGTESLNVPAQVETTIATHTFTISAQNTNNVSFNRSFTIQWKAPIWYGESALTTLTGSDVTALRVKNLATTANGNYAMLGGGYKWWAFPSSFTQPTQFKDINTQFLVAIDPVVDEVLVTNSFGVSTMYKLYRSYNILGGGINVQIS